MFQITLLAMGKLKENFTCPPQPNMKNACPEPAGFSCWSCRNAVCRNLPSRRKLPPGLAREAELIRQKIPKGAWFCVLTPEGRELSSEALAAQLSQSNSPAVFPPASHRSSFGIDRR